MYSVATTSGLSANACTLDDLLDRLGDHLAAVNSTDVIIWTISTYGDQVWTGSLRLPTTDRLQAVGEQLDHINARLVLAHLARPTLGDSGAGARLHRPLPTRGEQLTQPSFI